MVQVTHALKVLLEPVFEESSPTTLMYMHRTPTTLLDVHHALATMGKDHVHCSVTELKTLSDSMKFEQQCQVLPLVKAAEKFLAVDSFAPNYDGTGHKQAENVWVLLLEFFVPFVRLMEPKTRF